jgi:hypothetical protein
MTDILAVYFLLGISALFLVLLLIFKSKIIGVIGGVMWGLLSMYNFQRYFSSGDVDVGRMVWGLGWVCALAGLFCWIYPFFLVKAPKTEQPKIVEDDYYEKIEKNVARIRKRRPRRNTPWSV